MQFRMLTIDYPKKKDGKKIKGCKFNATKKS